MSDENNNELITSLDSTPLDIKNQQIAQKVLTEDDIDKVKDLTKLFNLNIRKKNVLRTLKMNDLLDKVTDQVVQRFEKTPNNFSNEDLIKYMQVIENSIDKANKNLNLVEETSPIQLMQNNQVNINIEDGLNRESRERVLEIVSSILNSNNSQDVDELPEIQNEVDENAN